MKSILENKIEKEFYKSRHGHYEDNSKNRRLKRVGQEYGKAAEEEDNSVNNSLKDEDKVKKIESVLEGIKDGKYQVKDDIVQKLEQKKQELIQKLNPYKKEKSDTCIKCTDIKEATKKLVEDYERIKELSYITVDVLNLDSVKNGLKFFIPNITFKIDDERLIVFVEGDDKGSVYENKSDIGFGDFVSFLLDKQTHRKEKLNSYGYHILYKIAEAVYYNVKKGNSNEKKREKLFKEHYKENIRDISKNLKIEIGKSMTFEEANQGRSNPNFNYDDNYKTNCQTCVVVHELRLRGFNIAAKSKDSEEQAKMSKDCSYAWIDPLTNRPPVVTRLSPKQDLWDNISKIMDIPGRYNFAFVWKDKGIETGHIITAMRNKDGSIKFYDPQSGSVLSKKELLDIISLNYDCQILRVDNLFIKPDIVKYYTTKYE